MSEEQLNTKGFTYVNSILTLEETQAALIECGKKFAAGGISYSRINSQREQVKLGRTLDQLGDGMKVAVEKLCKQLGHVCPDEGETPLMDVYILRTSAAETDKVCHTHCHVT